MEIYSITATCSNNSDTHLFEFTPENFEGVKIEQEFSFIPPIGYRPVASIDTMRIVKTDKSWIDNIFNRYGLESVVHLAISKLNSAGTGYALNNTMAIDFESYVIYTSYSEFGLKSVSAIDNYDNIKSTEIQLDYTSEANLPATKKFVNYVSLKNLNYWLTDRIYFSFQKNNDSKLYDNDSSLYHPTNPDVEGIVYYIGSGTPSYITMYISYSFNLLFIRANQTIQINLYKITSGGDISTVYTFFNGPIVSSGTKIELSGSTSFNLTSIAEGDFFIVATNIYSEAVISGELFLDIKKQTSVRVIGVSDNKISYIKTGEVLDYIFNNNAIYDAISDFDIGVTSANHLSKLTDTITIKPSEFLSDFCKANGIMLNFKLDGGVELKKISSYFSSLLNVSNAVEITNFKDVSFKYNSDLLFKSVSVGQEINDYDIYTYLLDWNKVLTFIQNDRNATENLDLSLQKYRVDFSGILDYFYKRSQQSDTTYSDNFIFDPQFNIRLGVPPSLFLYAEWTPRDILTKWSTFLSFCFQNFSKDTLTISSDGGNSDNLSIYGVKQMDDLTLNVTPRILPLQYDLTALISDLDFSEHILKINYEDEDIYLFVFKAETTDSLSEQKISALKIQF